MDSFSCKFLPCALLIISALIPEFQKSVFGFDLPDGITTSNLKLAHKNSVKILTEEEKSRVEEKMAS